MKAIMEALQAENPSSSSMRFTPLWARVRPPGARWTHPASSSLPSQTGACVHRLVHPQEIQASVRSRPALARRFQTLEVGEPTVDEAVDILKGCFRATPNTTVLRSPQEAVEAATHLAAKHISDPKLPDKAIDVIDETGASVRLAGGLNVSVDIEATVARIAQSRQVCVQRGRVSSTTARPISRPSSIVKTTR